MKVEPKQMTPAQMLAAAEDYYARQMVLLEKCHGTSWPERREWISDYLKEELRQRLIARGWRPAP